MTTMVDHTPHTKTTITAQRWAEALLAVVDDIRSQPATAPTGGPHVVDGQPATITARVLAQLGWPIDAIADLGSDRPTAGLTPAAAESARHMHEAEQAGRPLADVTRAALFGLTRFRCWLATPETMEDVTLPVRQALVGLPHDPIR